MVEASHEKEQRAKETIHNLKDVLTYLLTYLLTLILNFI